MTFKAQLIYSHGDTWTLDRSRHCDSGKMIVPFRSKCALSTTDGGDAVGVRLGAAPGRPQAGDVRAEERHRRHRAEVKEAAHSAESIARFQMKL